MPSATEAPQVYEVIIGESPSAIVDLRGILEEGELISPSPAPTVTAAGSGLAFDNIAVTTTAEVVNDLTVPIGQAVSFRVDASAGTEGEYVMKLTVRTTSIPAQTRERRLPIHVIA